jgi:hypothetical protein
MTACWWGWKAEFERSSDDFSHCTRCKSTPPAGDPAKGFQNRLNLIFIDFEQWQQMENGNQPYGYHIEIERETAEAMVLNFSIHGKPQAIIDYAGRRPAFSTAW